MAIPHAKSGEVVQLRLGAALPETKTMTLVKTNSLEVIRLVVPAGKEIQTHKAPGEITVQCLEGRVLFTAHEKAQELGAGQLLYLAAAEPHSSEGNRGLVAVGHDLLPKKEPQTAARYGAGSRRGVSFPPVTRPPSRNRNLARSVAPFSSVVLLNVVLFWRFTAPSSSR